MSHPGIWSGGSWRNPEQVVRDDVSVVLEDDLWNWHDLLRMADHPGGFWFFRIFRSGGSLP